MKATVTAVALSILAGFVSLSASDSPVLGKWNCVSVNNETGTKLAWTLNVREDADKLSASVVVAETGDEIPALDPKAPKAIPQL